MVGKPMAMELLLAGSTITVAHSHTDRDHLRDYVSKADILVVATGVPNLIPGVSLLGDDRLWISNSIIAF